MLHHDPQFLAGVAAERRTAAALRRPAADAGDLERTVLAAGAGDGAAWSALVDRFSGRIRAVARRHRLGAADVEEVLQSTWLRLVQNIAQVRSPKALGAWLETTARRESLHVLAQAARESPGEVEIEIDDCPAPPDDDDHLIAIQRRAALADALDRLPSHQRRLMMILASTPDASYHALSRALGIPIGSIGPTRGRALARLRDDEDLMAVLREA